MEEFWVCVLWDDGRTARIPSLFLTEEAKCWMAVNGKRSKEGM